MKSVLVVNGIKGEQLDMRSDRNEANYLHSVLIVEDDPIQVEIITVLLQNLGAVHVSAASDGKSAKDLVRNADTINLLVLDLIMPDFSWEEFLQYLREIDCQAPIMIASSADTAVRKAAAELAEAYGLNLVVTITKPLTLQKFASALTHKLLRD